GMEERRDARERHVRLRRDERVHRAVAGVLLAQHDRARARSLEILPVGGIGKKAQRFAVRVRKRRDVRDRDRGIAGELTAEARREVTECCPHAEVRCQPFHASCRCGSPSGKAYGPVPAAPGPAECANLRIRTRPGQRPRLLPPDFSKFSCIASSTASVMLTAELAYRTPSPMMRSKPARCA